MFVLSTFITNPLEYYDRRGCDACVATELTEQRFTLSYKSQLECEKEVVFVAIYTRLESQKTRGAVSLAGLASAGENVP